MAAQPHDMRLYATADNGHQINFAPPQAVADHVRHPPMMQHSTGSAFRPPGVPAVPMEQRFVPTGHIPSSSPHYLQQQQLVPSKSTNKHIMHPHQQQQQLNFQNVPVRHPFNQRNQVSSDLRPRGIEGGIVQPITPHQYPRELQAYGSAVKTGDPEALHQELRMMHTLHYQEKLARQQHGKKNNEAIWRQQMIHKLKGGQNPPAGLRHEIPSAEQLLIQQDGLFKEQVSQKAQQAYQPHPSQERFLRQYEELSNPGRRSLVNCPPPNANQTELNSFIPEVHSRLTSPAQQNIHQVHGNSFIPEGHSRLTSPAQQNIHQVVHGNFSQESKRYPTNLTHASQDYSGNTRMRQTNTPPQQQPHIIMAGHRVVQYSKPLEHAYQGELQNTTPYLHRRAMPAPPTVSDNITMVKQHTQQQPHLNYNQRVPVRADQLPAQQASCQAPPSKVKQHFPHDVVHAVEKQAHPHSLQHVKSNYHQFKERQREMDPRYMPPSRTYTESQCSTSPQRAISIKQEQMLLKEKLELSLQQASGGIVNKETQNYDISKHMKNTPDHTTTSNGAESMPRIVAVRSLANQETRNASMATDQGQSKSGHLKPVPGDVIPNDIRPTKPKSLMIKAHQEIYEVPMGAHRVPSRCSIDSENGRKDSWDSGIESPTLPDGSRENNMYVKRGTSLQYEAVASVSSLQQPQNLKPQENRGLEKCSPVLGQDCMSSKLPAAAAMDFRRARSLIESSNITTKELKAENRGILANSYTSGQLSDRLEENTVAKRQLEVMPKKRSWPCEDDCPIQPKVVNREVEALDYSMPETKSSSKELDNEPGCSDTVHEQTDLTEVPLDLTVKREMPKADVCTKEEKAGALCEDKSVSDSPLQGYFGTIMMRALKRLWASTRFKLEGAESAKPECTESSDEDSGKYFKPSSVTTLENVPGTDKVGDSQPQFAADFKNMVLPSKESCESLENAICELMQQSSGAFKHGGDIFQHFDVLIKRELLLEMENQALEDNEASTSTEIKTADVSGDPSGDKQTTTNIEDQSSEAIALHSSSPNCPPDCQDMDESQNLVIVESSMSPKVSPDSQEMSIMIDDDDTNLNDQTSSGEPQGTVAVDSSISNESPVENVYEKAARLAAEKAAREAAEKAAREAAGSAAREAPDNAAKVAADRSAMVAKVLSSPQEDDIKIGDSPVLEIIDVESGLSPQPSTSPLSKHSYVSTTVEEQTRTLTNSPPYRLKELYSHQEERNTSIGHSNTRGGIDLRCSDRKDDLSRFGESEVNVNKVHRQTCIERRSSVPVDLSGKSTPNLSSSHGISQPPPQRRYSEDVLSAVTVSGEHRSPSADGPQHSWKSYPKITSTSTIWQAQGMNANKVKLMKVPCSRANQVHSTPIPIVRDKVDMQGQFQRSPIVLLPKIMCVPGQSYPPPPPGSVVSSAPRNVVIIQRDQGQRQPNPVSVLNSPTVVHTPPSSTVQIPVYNITVGGNTSTSPAKNNSSTQSGPLSPTPTDNVVGPFRIIRKSPLEPSSTKKPSVNAYIIIYKNVSLPGVVRSGVPFVPPKMLQEGMFPNKTFDRFCHALQESNIMQRYMTVLERAALLPDLRHNKISSCKLVSLEEFHDKYDNIMQLMQNKDSDEVK